MNVGTLLICFVIAGAACALAGAGLVLIAYYFITKKHKSDKP